MKIKQVLSFNEKGRRDNNEDAVFVSPDTAKKNNGLFIVCDGMGGHTRGEVASNIVCNSISEYLLQHQKNEEVEQNIKDAIEFAQSKINEYITAYKDAAGMGTTLAMVYFTENGAYSVHIGDSRVYHIRNGKTLFATWDHSKINELIKAGILTPEKAKDSKRNVITRAMQGNLVKKIEPEITYIKNIYAGDYFLICSDGVWECFEDADIGVFLTGNESNDTKLENIKAVCEKNSKDNYTACLIEIGESGISKHIAIDSKSKKKKTAFFLMAITFLFIIITAIWYNYSGNNKKSDIKNVKTEKQENKTQEKNKQQQKPEQKAIQKIPEKSNKDNPIDTKKEVVNTIKKEIINTPDSILGKKVPTDSITNKE